jgi:hypothetical protein
VTQDKFFRANYCKTILEEEGRLENYEFEKGIISSCTVLLDTGDIILIYFESKVKVNHFVENLVSEIENNIQHLNFTLFQNCALRCFFKIRR